MRFYSAFPCLRVFVSYRYTPIFYGLLVPLHINAEAYYTIVVSVLVQYEVDQSRNVCKSWFDLQPHLYSVGVKVVEVWLVEVRVIEYYVFVGAPTRIWKL